MPEESEIRYAYIGPYMEPGHHSARKPWLCFRVEAYYRGEHIGFLRLEWTDIALIEKYFPTYWHYVSIMRGWALGLSSGADLYDPPTLLKTWKSAHLYAMRSPASHTECSPLNMAACVATHDEMVEDLHSLAPKTRWWGRMTQDLRPEYTYVGYIKVTPDYRRKGIATKMYQLAAMWLSVHRSQPLHGSSLQSPGALAAWSAMHTGEYPVYRIPHTGGKGEVYTLDYTAGDEKLLAEKVVPTIPYLDDLKMIPHQTPQEPHA